MNHCFMCKGKLHNQTTTFMVELDSTIIIVKNVPSLVCKQCGEISYTDEVAQKLESITKSIQGTSPEITIINYNKAA